MVDPELLSLLCCPETHQKLHLAGPELLEQLNRRISTGNLQNRGGRSLSQKLIEGLIREDNKVLYPVSDNIPVMLVEEGIVVG